MDFHFENSKLFKKKKSYSIIAFFFLFVFIVVLPCSMITHYANKLITKKLYHNNENYLSSASITLDNVFQSCNTHADIILQNTSEDFYTLLAAPNLDSPEASFASYQFQSTIRNLYFNQAFFVDAFIYFKNLDLVFTPSGSYDSNTYFHQHRIFESYSEDFFDTLTTTSYKNMFCPPTNILTKNSDNETELYSTAVPIAINLTGSAPSNAVFVLMLDEIRLNRVLDQLNTAQTSYLYIYDTDSNLILNQPADKDYAALLKLNQKTYNTSNGISHVHESEHYRILWQKSKVNRLIYICVEPNLLITEQLHSLLALTLIVVFVVLILCTFAYRWGAGRLQETLSSVLNHLKQTIDYPSSYEAPDTVNFSAVIDAAEVLHQQHEQNRPQLIHAFLIRLFHGKVDGSEVDEFCKRLQIFPKTDCFQILFIKTNFYIWEDSSSEEYSKTLKELEKLSSSFGYVIPSNDKYSFSVLLTSSSANELSIKMNQLIHLFQTKTEVTVPEAICTQSPVFHNITDASAHYHEIQTLLETRGISEEKFLYQTKDCATVTNIPFLTEDKNKIRSLIEHYPEKCPEYIQDLLHKYCTQNVTFSQYRTVIIELLFLLQELLYEYSISFSSLSFIEETELLQMSRQIITTKRLTAMCLHLYTNFANQLMKKQENSEPAEQLLLNFIDNHLKDVNLTMLADTLKMNQNYLSQYFKKHFGISFMEYITQKKMEKAKEMLIHTTLTCKAIGEELGYHDPNVFTRAFKKAESITPTEYRKRHKTLTL